MRIHKARNIARQIQRTDKNEISRDEIRQAFHVLDRQHTRRSVPRDERRADWRLAKVLWDEVGTWA